MSIIGDLARNVDPTIAVAREALRFGVQTRVTCTLTGAVLDVRRAVLVTVTGELGASTTGVYEAFVWDGYEPKLREQIAEMNARGLAHLTISEIIDGRVIFGGRKGLKHTMTADAAMTAIVDADSVYAAYQVVAALPAGTLRRLADLMHIEVSTKRPAIVDRVIAEARA